MIRWNIDKIKKYVEENTESKLISDKYENQNKELEFICKCGNLFKRTWKVFLRGSHNCKKCSWEKINKNRKYTIEYVRRFVNENSTSELISKKYAHCKEKLEFKCECGEKFLTHFDNFKNGNKRKCNKCSITDGMICSDGIIRPNVGVKNKTHDEFLKQLKTL